jgi:sortase (surface protein transpeptidase)
MTPARPAARLAGLGLLLSVAACGPSGAGGRSTPDGAAAPSRQVAAETFRSSRTYDTAAVPVRLRIPVVGVDTRLEGLGRAADRTIALPSAPGVAGWYDEGPRPGQAGPAVIIGHVDWDHSPAVFYRLSELRPGAAVHVDRADGSTVRFRVTSRKQIAKSRFPTDDVYAPDLAPSLRLITCGGSFDRASRNYRDNVIVFAAPG